MARAQRSMSGAGRMPRPSTASTLAESTQRMSARGAIVISVVGSSMYMSFTIRK